MHPKPIYRRYLWLLLMPLLVGCNLRKLYIVPTSTIDAPTQPSLSLTATEQPTAIDPTTTPTETPVPTSTPQSSTLDGLRVAYMIEGNIYLQDSGGQPIQLTNSGEDRQPRFTDDGEKIVFFRSTSEKQHQLYVMNSDGSQQQPLITGSILASLGLGYDELTEVNNLAFVPGTHQIVFNTQQFRAIGGAGEHAVDHKNQDLLLMDMDTAKFIKFQDSAEDPFQVSPNGKFVFDTSNIFSITGESVQRNLIPDLPKRQWVEWFPPFWTHDSSKVIMLPPIDRNAEPASGPQERAILQYAISDNAPMETRLNPAPINSFSISPDGNWIAYDYFYYRGYTDEQFTNGLYIGSLLNGNSQLIASYAVTNPLEWSPDSEYFVFNDANDQLYLANRQGDVTIIDYGIFIRWLDNNHYLYKRNDIWMCGIDKKECAVVLDLPESHIKYIRDYNTAVLVQPNVP